MKLEAVALKAEGKALKLEAVALKAEGKALKLQAVALKAEGKALELEDLALEAAGKASEGQAPRSWVRAAPSTAVPHQHSDQLPHTPTLAYEATPRGRNPAYEGGRPAGERFSTARIPKGEASQASRTALRWRRR